MSTRDPISQNGHTAGTRRGVCAAISDTEYVMPDVPSDVTVGELYRLLVRLEGAVSDLGLRLESKVVTIDVYQIAQKQLQAELAEVKEDLSRHVIAGEIDNRERKQIRAVLAGAVIAAAVSFAMGAGAIIANVVH